MLVSSQLLALELDRCRKGDSVSGYTGHRPELLLLISLPRARATSARFFIRSRDSPYVALLLHFARGLGSGLSIHQEDLPASSLGTLTNL